MPPEIIARGLSDATIAGICRALDFLDLAAGEGIQLGEIDALDTYTELSESLGFEFDDYGQIGLAVRAILERDVDEGVKIT